MIVDGILCESATFEQSKARRALAARVVAVREETLRKARVALEAALSRFEAAAKAHQEAVSHLTVCIREEEALATLYDGNGTSG